MVSRVRLAFSRFPLMMGALIVLGGQQARFVAGEDATAAFKSSQTVTGLHEFGEPVPPVHFIVEDDKTPFIGSGLKGKSLWRVMIRNVSLRLPSAQNNVRDRYRRDFEVIIDPQTNAVLRVRSHGKLNDPDLLPEPPAAAAEYQMLGTGEKYVGFVIQPPKVSLGEFFSTPF